MIVSEAEKATTLVNTLPSNHPPTMQAAMLISPEGFGINEESVTDNQYIQAKETVDLEVAHRQHANLARTIRGLGLPVVTFPGRPDEPDGVFGNNVFATTPSRFIIGRMFHPSRQRETTRDDVRHYFQNLLGRPLYDLSDTDAAAELTGALVVDRAKNFGICGMSNRATEAGSKNMHQAFGLNLTLNSHLKESEYHTNVVLAILAGKLSIVAPSAFETEDVRVFLASAYGKRVVELDDTQPGTFAANCIAVTPNDVLMSQNGLDSLRPDQLSTIEGAGLKLHGVDMSEFEKAGGSLRCLVTEIF
ncbi:MAG: arginine deiminase-related protein [Myxococcota bacterium]|nr:arginine deiminase-related protein [Myxococcota bacterium]